MKVVIVAASNTTVTVINRIILVADKVGDLTVIDSEFDRAPSVTEAAYRMLDFNGHVIPHERIK